MSNDFFRRLRELAEYDAPPDEKDYSPVGEPFKRKRNTAGKKNIGPFFGADKTIYTKLKDPISVFNGSDNGAALEDPLDILTIDNVVKYYYNVTHFRKDIRNSALRLMYTEDESGYKIYRIDQYFLDDEGNIITSSANPQWWLGRSIYTFKLDDELTETFGRQNPFII